MKYYFASFVSTFASQIVQEARFTYISQSALTSFTGSFSREAEEREPAKEQMFPHAWYRLHVRWAATTDQRETLPFGFCASHWKTAFCFSGGNGPVLVWCWMAGRKFLSLLRYKEETTVSGQYQEWVQNLFYDNAIPLAAACKNCFAW